MGLYLFMVIILASQVLRSNGLPPAKQIITVLGCFVVAVTVHEFMHAFAALRLGDPTATNLGRLSLNPMVHFEPFGFFGMVMISLGYSFIGWGKPVPVSMGRLNGKGIDGRERSMALIAFAGPLSNVVMAALSALALRMMDGTSMASGDVYYVASWFFYVNVLLAAFNAIPIPPLDGYRILLGILPSFWTPILAPLERFGFMALFLLFFLGSILGTSAVTQDMIAPVQTLLYRMLP